MGKLISLALGLSAAEATFERRGFQSSNDDTRRRLEAVGATFLLGYNAALQARDCDCLGARLNEVESDRRGFAFEGAAMALGILDFMTSWKKSRFDAFLKGPGSHHKYMVHVGLGWAWARLPISPTRALGKLDPLIGWLAFDGYGFHEGYFHWAKYRDGGMRKPQRLGGYAARVFDQGLGRSLWFVEGADVGRITTDISKLDPSRHADLWSGVGLACAYAGSLEPPALQELRRSAGPMADKLAQGAAFAAKTRQLAGNPADHTERACRALCHMTADQAAQVTDLSLDMTGSDQTIPAYEIWRQRIQARFATEVIAT
jgi:hypothetical protein